MIHLQWVCLPFMRICVEVGQFGDGIGARHALPLPGRLWEYYMFSDRKQPSQISRDSTHNGLPIAMVLLSSEHAPFSTM
jgi:hypothetical protein